VDTTDTDDEEAIATLDGQLLSNLVGAVLKVDFNDSMLGSLYELQTSGCKSKSSSMFKSKQKSRVQKSKCVSK
jgi:hypothetical protein